MKYTVDSQGNKSEYTLELQGDKNGMKKNSKNEVENETKNEAEEGCTVGWDAITEAFEKIYPNEEPKCYGVVVPYMLGGKDPLDGICVYVSEEYYHFVTLGLSELYEKRSKDEEWSGYGMEFTMKLKKSSINPKDEDNELKCVFRNFQSIARLTFERGELFQTYEYIYTGQKEGIDFHQTSKLTGFILIEDTNAGTIMTPNGKVEFVEFVGCTDAELLELCEKRLTVGELYQKLGTDITDYKRASVI